VPKVRTGKVGLSVEFDKPVNINLSLILYCEYQAVLSQTKDGEVKVNYNTGI